MKARPARLVTAMFPLYVPLPYEPSAFCERASQARPSWIVRSASGVIISPAPTGTSPLRGSPKPASTFPGSSGAAAAGAAASPTRPRVKARPAKGGRRTIVRRARSRPRRAWAWDTVSLLPGEALLGDGEIIQFDQLFLGGEHDLAFDVIHLLAELGGQVPPLVLAVDEGVLVLRLGGLHVGRLARVRAGRLAGLLLAGLLPRHVHQPGL